MKIKAFSFEKDSITLAAVKNDVISKTSENSVYFDSFSDPNKLFKGISEALESSEVLLIGVETGYYLKFKPVLIKAFNLAPSYSEKIDNAIGSEILEEKLRKAHSLVPENAVELISENGLYSGFYVKSAEQYIVVFPLNENIVPHILVNSSLPFFKGEEAKEATFEDISSSAIASPKAKNIVAKRIKNNLRLAIPSTPASKVLKEDIKNCAHNEGTVFFTPFVNDDGVENLKEYAAQLAKGAMDLRNAELGASISNIFREKNGDTVISYYTFISVATDEKVIVKKLFANPGESIDNLIIEATNELYVMIDKYIDEVVFKLTATDEEKAKYEQALIEAEIQANARPVASVGKKGTIAAIAVFIVAVVICVILGFKFGGYFVTSSDAPEKNSLQAGDTNNVQSDDTTKPVVTVNNTPSESTSEESSTSIFDVTATLPNVTQQPHINYQPNPNNTQPQVQQPQTQAPQPETQAPQPETQAPPPETQAPVTETTIPQDSF